jgi:hypothetical protein
MHHQNLDKLKSLRLFGMARAMEELQNLTDRGQLDFADQLALLIDREATDRANAAERTFIVSDKRSLNADPTEAGSPASVRLL